jgi:hypothetical protein
MDVGPGPRSLVVRSSRAATFDPNIHPPLTDFKQKNGPAPDL